MNLISSIKLENENPFSGKFLKLKEKRKKTYVIMFQLFIKAVIYSTFRNLMEISTKCAIFFRFFNHTILKSKGFHVENDGSNRYFVTIFYPSSFITVKV